MQQDYEKMLESFLNERENTIEWLRTLKDAQWQNYAVHPVHGNLTAEMFLINWPAHDYLHIRQITRLKYDYLKNLTGDSLQYAGGW